MCICAYTKHFLTTLIFSSRVVFLLLLKQYLAALLNVIDDNLGLIEVINNPDDFEDYEKLVNKEISKATTAMTRIENTIRISEAVIRSEYQIDDATIKLIIPDEAFNNQEKVESEIQSLEQDLELLDDEEFKRKYSIPQWEEFKTSWCTMDHNLSSLHYSVE
jgi:hypothetical protein